MTIVRRSKKKGLHKRMTLGKLVRQRLLEHLVDHWSPDHQLPPISDLAQKYRVSVGTIQQAITSLTNDGILVARRRVGTRLAPDCSLSSLREQLKIQNTSSSPSKAAVSRRPLEGKCIQIVRSNDAVLVKHISETCARKLLQLGAKVEMITHAKYGYTSSDTFDWTDAIVVVQPTHFAKFENMDTRKPLLIIETSRCEILRSANYDILTVDDEHGSMLAGQRLIAAGCKHVCFIGRHANPKKGEVGEFDIIATRRLQGLERGLATDVAPPYRLKVASYHERYGVLAFDRYLKLSPRPDGIFAATDELAIGFIQAAEKEGLKAGEDYQIIGFDKQQDQNAHQQQTLTTIEVPRTELGLRGAELLSQRMANTNMAIRRVHLGCQLFEGTTVKPIDISTD